MADIGQTAVPCRGHDCDDSGTALVPDWVLLALASERAGRAAARRELSGVVPLWPADGADQLARWVRSAAPGDVVDVGLYRVTRTHDERLTLTVHGPRGAETTIERGRPAQAAQFAAAWIAADVARLRGGV